MTERDADVVVIGAGVSGLATARALHVQGLKTIVLEARDRIGGRVHTVRDGRVEVPIELGAELVHGRPPPLTRLLQEAGLTACDVEERHWFLRDGALAPNDDFGDVMERFVRLGKRRRRDVSVGRFLDELCARQPAWRKHAPGLRMYCEGFHGANVDDFSLHALVREETAEGEGDEVQRVMEGYARVPAFLAAGLPRVQLSTVVTVIRWSRSEVRVQAQAAHGTALRTVRARAVVVTVPLGVLQARPGERGAIRFDPPLPRKEKAIAELRMGAVERSVLRFRSAFWEEGTRHLSREAAKKLAFAHDERAAIPTWWTMRPLRTPLLVAWVGGPGAERLATLDDEARISTTVDALARLLGVERARVEGELEQVHHHAWGRDPFARGGYAYVPIGGLHATAALARPVEDTLFFAGEATHVGGHTGTVHGALESGERAAREVRRALAVET